MNEAILFGIWCENSDTHRCFGKWKETSSLRSLHSSIASWKEWKSDERKSQ